MLKTIEGIYKEGKVELTERPEGVGDEVPVLVTFLPPHRIDLRAHGIDEIQAADLRARLKTFAADWEDPEMDVYDELGPREALELLNRLEAPIAPVEKMLEESVRGRYSRSDG